MTLEIGYNATAGSHLQTNLLNLNQVPTATMNTLIGQMGATPALNLLRADITSPAAAAAGIREPFAGFKQLWGTSATVAQALRPYPQYSSINTGVQNGDKSGHSAYHAFVLKADRRFSKGFTGQWSYVFSKLMTDSDTYFAVGTGAQDHYNRSLEKSIGQYDQTHSVKFSTLYDLPFGKGQRWATSGIASHLLGGWRIAAIQVYNSGAPLALSRNNPLPIFNSVTRPVVDGYEDWRAPIAGDQFDPNVDRFLKPVSAFPAQPAAAFGNATRYNPKVRAFWGQSENVSIARTFRITESIRVDLRGEAFNIFNRTIFGTGNLNLNNAAFAQVTNQTNDPRQMQMGLKLYW
jgi:hypothetical protein